MIKNDIHPPNSGLNADPVLYGVAAALAEMFPPVTAHESGRGEQGRTEGEDEREDRDQGRSL